MEQQTIQFQRKRKFLLFLPLLIIPIAGLTFYALGGGQPDKQTGTVQKGINASLPGATFTKQQGPEDKMALYEKQKRDSINASQKDASSFIAGMGFDTARSRNNSADESAAQLKAKLAALKSEVSKPQPVAPSYSAGVSAADVQTKKLQQMVEAMKHSNSGEDPEMKQLDGLMGKLLDLQHPERVKQRLEANKPPEPDSLYQAIRAVVESNQKVVNGASVKLRLSDTLTLHGQMIPKGQLLFGICQVTNQRLLLRIKTIRLGTSILPVDLSVYDLDAIEGIRAPDAITEDALRSGSNNAVQSLQLLSMDQSLGTQAASAGVAAAKSLFSKKVKVVKVKLHNGYPLLLRDNEKKYLSHK